MEIRTWEEMDLDCLVNIFSKLGIDDLTTAIPFVCKSWNQASIDPLCCRIVDFSNIEFDPSSFSAFLKLSLARANGAVSDLRFNSQISASKQDISLASDECPNLKSLFLPRIDSDGEEQLLKAITKWRDLEVLEMESKPSGFSEMVMQIGTFCKKFQGLKIRGSITKEDVSMIVKSLPNLKWLDLSCCCLGREELFVLVDGFTDLKRLSVRECVGFEVDEEMKRRASGIELFEFEGSLIEISCESEIEDPENSSIEQMLMYYDDCYAMWLF